jgi:RNA polymerase sigma factor (sigma-70 family)
MPTTALGGVLRQLRRAALLRAGWTDAQLVESYLSRRDEAAFEALLCRHGPMVWGVCRRALHDEADAEDAFQATFLVFVRRAATLTNRAAVGNWLYGVANKTARKARAMLGRRRAEEPNLAAHRAAWQEEAEHPLVPLLDVELSRLPDKYRVPLVLCELEGASIQEAARQLGCPQGTVASRLARGRVLLAQRIKRRGLHLAGGLLAAGLAPTAWASMPAALTASTLQTVRAGPAGQTPDVVPANVAALAEGVIKTMTLRNFQIAAAAVCAAAVVVLGLLWGVYLPAQAATVQQSKIRQHVNVATVQDRDADEDRARQADAKGHILFAHAPRDSTEPVRVASIQIGDKKTTLLFERPDIFKGIAGEFRLSPDGKRVAYILQKNDDGNVIYVRSLDPVGPPQDMGVDGRNVCWSPDGSQLAVSRGKSGNVILDVKTRKQTVVELPPDYAVEDWSPDGKWFLLRLTPDKGKTQLAWMKRGDAKVYALADTEGAWEGRIAPDGKQILFVRPAAKGASNLWVVNRVDGKTRQVTQELNGCVMGFSWSPSGKRIAYTLVRFDPDSAIDPHLQDTESLVIVSDPDGNNQEILTSGKTGGTWSVDFTLWDWR